MALERQKWCDSPTHARTFGGTKLSEAELRRTPKKCRIKSTDRYTWVVGSLIGMLEELLGPAPHFLGLDF